MNILNLDAETGANAIGDDATPTLTLGNSSTGESLRLQTTGGVALSLVSTPTTGVFSSTMGAAGHFRSNASLSPSLLADMGVISSPTVAVMRLTQSAASGAFFEFKGFLASTTSMGSIVRGVRVKFGDEYGFIPVYASGTFI